MIRPIHEKRLGINFVKLKHWLEGCRKSVCMHNICAATWRNHLNESHEIELEKKLYDIVGPSGQDWVLYGGVFNCLGIGDIGDVLGVV